MITRYKIKLDGTETMDIAEREAFNLPDFKYPSNWLVSGGTLPSGYTAEPYDATPPPPPVPEPSATGAQMVDEAKSRNRLNALLAVLTESERAVFYTRRRIVAGSPFAEVLRGKLGVSVSTMEDFIATASIRSEV